MGTLKQRRKRRTKKVLHANSGPASIQFEPVSVDLAASSEDQLPTFDAVAYSGGKLYVKGFKHPVIVDVSGLEVNANAVILLDHDSKKRVGHPESIIPSNGQIRATGIVSADNEHSTEVVKSHRNGFRWQMSIGARIKAAYEVPAGKKVTVNGRVHDGPVIVATKSRLNEISFVGSGGDEDNVVRIAAESGADEEPQSDDSKELRGNAPSDQTEGKEMENESKKQDVAAETDGQDLIAQMRSDAAAESKRISSIRKICGGRHSDIEAQAITEGWDDSKTELYILRAERESTDNDQVQASSGPFIQSRKPAERDHAGRAIAASLCMQFGMTEESAGKHYDEKVMDDALSASYRNIGLHYLMYETLRASGRSYRPGVMDAETIRDFLRAEQELQASAPGTFSYLSTTGILSNVANKSLLDSFISVKTTVPTLFGRRSVNDFKQHSSYRLAMNGELEEVTGGGEIKHADLGEESFTNQAKTWGKMLTLTRKDMINDDLGAFESIPRLLGRKSAIKLEKEGWKLVLSNPSSFFSSGNKNNQSGATTALSIDSLTAAEQLMMDQVDEAGDPIMISARYLVTGTALATVASQLMTETRILMEARDTSSSAKKAAPASNPHAGKWTPISTPYINSQALTGSSATLWYLWGDPMEEAPFVVSYLNGRDTPTIESSDVDFNRLGMSWRAVFDFGVDAREHRAAVRSVGA